MPIAVFIIPESTQTYGLAIVLVCYQSKCNLRVPLAGAAPPKEGTSSPNGVYQHPQYVVLRMFKP